MYHSQVPIKSFVQFDFKRYIKVTPNVIDPYREQKFTYRDITSEVNKAERLHKYRV
jgi:hypothetical protein